MTAELPPPPPHPSNPSHPAHPAHPDSGTSARPSRFVGEVMGGGAMLERADDELVGGWRGALGVATVVALIGVLGLFNIWWLVFVVGLLISIFLHELGHFMTARLTGMKATQFFLGFGPRVWSFRRGETEYGLRALPLGAFVKIIGMNNIDEVDPADEQRTYRVKSYPKRMLVISAGSLMHMLLAIVLLFAVYAGDGEPVERDGAKVAVGSDDDPAVTGAALVAGVQPGDVIVKIADQSVNSPDALGAVVRAHQPGDVVSVEVLRDGAPLVLSATLGTSLPAGAQVISVEDLALTDVNAIAALLDDVDSDVVGVEIIDGSSSPSSTGSQVLPAKVTIVDGEVIVAGATMLGVSSGINYATIEHSVPAAAWNSVIDIAPTSWAMAQGALKVLNPISVFTHVTGSNDDLATRPTTLVGVTGVADDVGESEGIFGMLFLLAVLNVFVGVFNMFPLLPLDGGHAAVATYERIREGRRARLGQRYYADVNKLMPFAMAVVMVLGFLFLSGLYLDITSPIG